MRIIVDAMGGDNAPFEIVKGAIEAAEKFNTEIVLVGRGEDILRSLEQMGRKQLPAGVEIANATEVIEMEDDPATATRIKSDSSMTVGLRLLKDSKADAMVSAGSTGALLSGSTLIVKRIKGIRRATLAPILPNNGKGALLIDCGANAECTSEYLLQFAFMGYYYAKNMLGIENPRVGLLNIGAEESKGTALQKETFALLQRASEDGRINFVGNVEARGVLLGDCDVLVSDGFSGNILLKGIEGAGIYITREMKVMFNSSFVAKIAAFLVRNKIKQLKKQLDSSEVGGTAMLGISKPVIKAHGSSDAKAIMNAIRQAIATVESGVCNDISENVEYMKVAVPMEKTETD